MSYGHHHQAELALLVDTDPNILSECSWQAGRQQYNRKYNRAAGQPGVLAVLVTK